MWHAYDSIIFFGYKEILGMFDWQIDERRVKY